MSNIVSWFVKICRQFLYNTPIRNWRLTAFLYGKIGRLFLTREEHPLVDLAGIKLKTIGSDTSITTALVNGHYENFTLQVAKRLFSQARNKPLVFADIGANIGIFAVSLAAYNPASLIYAFEANPDSFKILRENILLNSLSNVTPVNCAVGDRSGTVSLDISSPCNGTHSIFSKGTNRINTSLVSLDEFFTGKVLPALVKIDVEGYEPNVLQGMKSLLKLSSLQVILEFNPEWLKRGNQDPDLFLKELEEKFNSIFCLDEINEQAHRYTRTNNSLNRKLMTVGFNLLLVKGDAPAF